MSQEPRSEERSEGRVDVGSICRSSHGDPGDEWLCTLDLDHSGDHQAWGPGQGRLFASWPQDPPRSWSLPPEPGPEVTRLRDRVGHLWLRQRDEWAWVDPECDRPDLGTHPRPFRELLFGYGPLTDATQDTTP